MPSFWRKHGHNELAISDTTKLVVPITYNCIAKGKLIIGRRTCPHHLFMVRVFIGKLTYVALTLLKWKRVGVGGLNLKSVVTFNYIYFLKMVLVLISSVLELVLQRTKLLKENQIL